MPSSDGVEAAVRVEGNKQMKENSVRFTRKMQKVFIKLGELMASQQHPPAKIPLPSSQPAVIENTQVYSDDVNSYGTFEDVLEKRQCQYLSSRLQQCLRVAKEKYMGGCELFLPSHLTPYAAQDIMRLSEKEPCGIRGCHLIVYYSYASGTEGDGGIVSKKLGSIQPDPDTVPTFELVLTFHEDRSKHWWDMVAILPFPHCLAAAANQTVILSPGFTLVKHKLYRS